jgi:hypothetical protein
MKRLAAYGAAFACSLALVTGCAQKSNEPAKTDTGHDTPTGTVEIVDDGTTDQMFNDEKSNETLYVCQIEGETLTTDMAYPVHLDFAEQLQDGHFYKLVADVTYLNGGIAGYVNFPEIQQVKSCEETSPFDMGLPAITDTVYGLTIIGDYAEGDVLLYEGGIKAVWKDGAWIYHYDRSMKLEDGTLVCCGNDVTEAEVMEGIQKGINSCERYFAYPGN